MVGGAKFQQEVLDWTKQSSHLYITVACALIFMWAVYSEKIPAAWRWQLSTTIGRMASWPFSSTRFGSVL
jgi:hypothetical protein